MYGLLFRPARRGAATLLAVNHVVVRTLYGHQGIERLIEGNPDVLIQDGVVLTDRLKRESITPAELRTAAHKQGFGALDEIDRAVLEPGGGLSFFARKPSPDVARHTELIARLDRLSAEVEALGRRRTGEPQS